jgi:WD40 repeat protein
LASGSDDNTVKLWSVESQKEVTTLQGHDNIVLSVAFSPDGKYLASGSWDNTVKLWSVKSFQEI